MKAFRVRRVASLLPVGSLVVSLVALYLIPGLSGQRVTSSNAYDVLQIFSSVGLLTLGLMITMVAGEFDLSVVGTYAVGGMLAVKTGEDHPILGVVVAVLAGAFAGLIQGGAIAKFRINSMPVTLGGYIALLGLTSVIGHSQSVSYANIDAGLRVDQPIAQIFSLRSLICLALFAVVFVVMGYGRVGRNVKAVGGDRRAARVVGVPVDLYIIGAFVASGALAALAGALFSYSLNTAVVDPGSAPLIFAASAALLGGVSLSGGIGNVAGVLAAGLALSILQELFTIQATAAYFSDLITGAILLLVATLTAPRLIPGLRTLRPRRLVAAVGAPSREDH